MLKRHNPATVHAPAGRYTHAVEAPPGARLVYVSGQVGMKPDGKTVPGEAAQCEQAWANVKNVLAGAGMGPADIVKLNIYVTRPDVIPHVRAARDKALGGAGPPASTLAVIAALADPAWVVEIECVAAKA